MAVQTWNAFTALCRGAHYVSTETAKFVDSIVRGDNPSDFLEQDREIIIACCSDSKETIVFLELFANKLATEMEKDAQWGVAFIKEGYVVRVTAMIWHFFTIKLLDEFNKGGKRIQIPSSQAWASLLAPIIELVAEPKKNLDEMTEAVYKHLFPKGELVPKLGIPLTGPVKGVINDQLKKVVEQLDQAVSANPVNSSDQLSHALAMCFTEAALGASAKLGDSMVGFGLGMLCESYAKIDKEEYPDFYSQILPYIAKTVGPKLFGDKGVLTPIMKQRVHPILFRVFFYLFSETHAGNLNHAAGSFLKKKEGILHYVGNHPESLDAKAPTDEMKGLFAKFVEALCDGWSNGELRSPLRPVPNIAAFKVGGVALPLFKFIAPLICSRGECLPDLAKRWDARFFPAPPLDEPSSSGASLLGRGSQISFNQLKHCIGKAIKELRTRYLANPHFLAELIGKRSAVLQEQQQELARQLENALNQPEVGRCYEAFEALVQEFVLKLVVATAENFSGSKELFDELIDCSNHMIERWDLGCLSEETAAVCDRIDDYYKELCSTSSAVSEMVEAAKEKSGRKYSEANEELNAFIEKRKDALTKEKVELCKELAVLQKKASCWDFNADFRILELLENFIINFHSRRGLKTMNDRVLDLRKLTVKALERKEELSATAFQALTAIVGGREKLIELLPIHPDYSGTIVDKGIPFILDLVALTVEELVQSMVLIEPAEDVSKPLLEEYCSDPQYITEMLRHMIPRGIEKFSSLLTEAADKETSAFFTTKLLEQKWMIDIIENIGLTIFANRARLEHEKRGEKISSAELLLAIVLPLIEAIDSLPLRIQKKGAGAEAVGEVCQEVSREIFKLLFPRGDEDFSPLLILKKGVIEVLVRRAVAIALEHGAMGVKEVVDNTIKKYAVNSQDIVSIAMAQYSRELILTALQDNGGAVVSVALELFCHFIGIDEKDGKFLYAEAIPYFAEKLGPALLSAKGALQPLITEKGSAVLINLFFHLFSEVSAERFEKTYEMVKDRNEEITAFGKKHHFLREPLSDESAEEELAALFRDIVDDLTQKKEGASPPLLRAIPFIGMLKKVEAIASLMFKIWHPLLYSYGNSKQERLMLQGRWEKIHSSDSKVPRPSSSALPPSGPFEFVHLSNVIDTMMEKLRSGYLARPEYLAELLFGQISKYMVSCRPEAIDGYRNELALQLKRTFEGKGAPAAFDFVETLLRQIGLKVAVAVAERYRDETSSTLFGDLMRCMAAIAARREAEQLPSEESAKKKKCSEAAVAALIALVGGAERFQELLPVHPHYAKGITELLIPLVLNLMDAAMDAFTKEITPLPPVKRAVGNTLIFQHCEEPKELTRWIMLLTSKGWEKAVGMAVKEIEKEDSSVAYMCQKVLGDPWVSYALWEILNSLFGNKAAAAAEIKGGKVNIGELMAALSIPIAAIVSAAPERQQARLAELRKNDQSRNEKKLRERALKEVAAEAAEEIFRHLFPHGDDDFRPLVLMKKGVIESIVRKVISSVLEQLLQELEANSQNNNPAQVHPLGWAASNYIAGKVLLSLDGSRKSLVQLLLDGLLSFMDAEGGDYSSAARAKELKKSMADFPRSQPLWDLIGSLVQQFTYRAISNPNLRVAEALVGFFSEKKLKQLLDLEQKYPFFFYPAQKLDPKQKVLTSDPAVLSEIVGTFKALIGTIRGNPGVAGIPFASKVVGDEQIALLLFRIAVPILYKVINSEKEVEVLEERWRALRGEGEQFLTFAFLQEFAKGVAVKLSSTYLARPSFLATVAATLIKEELPGYTVADEKALVAAAKEEFAFIFKRALGVAPGEELIAPGSEVSKMLIVLEKNIELFILSLIVSAVEKNKERTMSALFFDFFEVFNNLRSEGKLSVGQSKKAADKLIHLLGGDEKIQGLFPVYVEYQHSFLRIVKGTVLPIIFEEMAGFLFGRHFDGDVPAELLPYGQEIGSYFSRQILQMLIPRGDIQRKMRPAYLSELLLRTLVLPFVEGWSNSVREEQGAWDETFNAWLALQQQDKEEMQKLENEAALNRWTPEQLQTRREELLQQRALDEVKGPLRRCQTVAELRARYPLGCLSENHDHQLLLEFLAALAQAEAAAPLRELISSHLEGLFYRALMGARLEEKFGGLFEMVKKTFSKRTESQGEQSGILDLKIEHRGRREEFKAIADNRPHFAQLAELFLAQLNFKEDYMIDYLPNLKERLGDLLYLLYAAADEALSPEAEGAIAARAGKVYDHEWFFEFAQLVMPNRRSDPYKGSDIEAFARAAAPDLIAWVKSWLSSNTSLSLKNLAAPIFGLLVDDDDYGPLLNALVERLLFNMIVAIAEQASLNVFPDKREGLSLQERIVYYLVDWANKVLPPLIAALEEGKGYIELAEAAKIFDLFGGYDAFLALLPVPQIFKESVAQMAANVVTSLIYRYYLVASSWAREQQQEKEGGLAPEVKELLCGQSAKLVAVVLNDLLQRCSESCLHPIAAGGAARVNQKCSHLACTILKNIPQSYVAALYGEGDKNTPTNDIRRCIRTAVLYAKKYGIPGAVPLIHSIFVRFVENCSLFIRPVLSVETNTSPFKSKESLTFLEALFTGYLKLHNATTAARRQHASASKSGSLHRLKAKDEKVALKKGKLLHWSLASDDPEVLRAQSSEFYGWVAKVVQGWGKISNDNLKEIIPEEFQAYLMPFLEELIPHSVERLVNEYKRQEQVMGLLLAMVSKMKREYDLSRSAEPVKEEAADGARRNGPADASEIHVDEDGNRMEAPPEASGEGFKEAKVPELEGLIAQEIGELVMAIPLIFDHFGIVAGIFYDKKEAASKIGKRVSEGIGGQIAQQTLEGLIKVLLTTKSKEELAAAKAAGKEESAFNKTLQQLLTETAAHVRANIVDTIIANAVASHQEALKEEWESAVKEFMVKHPGSWYAEFMQSAFARAVIELAIYLFCTLYIKKKVRDILDATLKPEVFDNYVRCTIEFTLRAFQYPKEVIQATQRMVNEGGDRLPSLFDFSGRRFYEEAAFNAMLKEGEELVLTRGERDGLIAIGKLWLETLERKGIPEKKITGANQNKLRAIYRQQERDEKELLELMKELAGENRSLDLLAGNLNLNIEFFDLNGKTRRFLGKEGGHECRLACRKDSYIFIEEHVDELEG